MTILSIDTSCDETSAAVLDRDRVLSSVTWSQIKYHRRWGGVVPSIARRAHTERLPLVVSRALRLAKAFLPSSSLLDLQLTTHNPQLIAAIAVTVGPGLAPALEAGIHYAKALALLHKIPLIPVNHLEGHIASIFLKRRSAKLFVNNLTIEQFNNFLSLVVSGGHTELTLSDWSGPSVPSSPSFPSSFSPSHRLLGQTLDDAAGECLDKVGRELGFGYPAGPVVEKLARFSSSRAEERTLSPQAKCYVPKSRDLAKRFIFPIPLQRSPRADLNFSFSGLKTAAIQIIHGTHNIEKAGKRQELSKLANKTSSRAKSRDLAKRYKYDFCSSFQEAVINALLFKLKRAIQITEVKTVILTGGVAANNRLRRRAAALVRSLGGNFYPAPKQFTGDNAAMIGLAAHWALARGEAAKTETEINAIDRQPNLNFESPRHSERIPTHVGRSRGI